MPFPLLRPEQCAPLFYASTRNRRVGAMAEIFLKRHELSGGLPRVCVLCGASSAGDREITLQYQPAWWMTMFSRITIVRYQTVRLPVCESHGFYFYRSLVLGLGGFAVLFLSVPVVILAAVLTQSGYVPCIGIPLLVLYALGWIGTLLVL